MEAIGIHLNKALNKPTPSPKKPVGEQVKSSTLGKCC